MNLFSVSVCSTLAFCSFVSRESHRVTRLSLSHGLLPNIRKSSVAASPYYPRER